MQRRDGRGNPRVHRIHASPNARTLATPREPRDHVRSNDEIPDMARGILLAALLVLAMTPAHAADKGHITGVGGIFFKSKDPKALAAWYRDVLGLDVEGWGGAALKTDVPDRPPVVVWTPFPKDTDYFAPSGREYMINFAVDDLDAMLAKLKEKGVAVLKREDSVTDGRFAWITDPDGTKIELWEPKRP